MQPAASIESGTEGLWCEGLPCAGYEAIRPDEERALRGRLAELDARAVRVLLVAFGLPTLLFVGGNFFPSRNELAILIFALVILGGVLVGFPIGFLRMRDVNRLRRPLARDLALGEMLVFRWSESGDAPPIPCTAPEVRVFPHAAARMRAGADGRSTFERVRIQAAAPPPEYAMRAAMADDLVPIEAPEGLSFEQRRLTPWELREVADYARQLRKFDPWLAFGIVAPSWGLFDITRRHLPEPESFLRSSTVICLSICAGVLFVRGRELFWRLRASRRLASDHGAGRVITMVRDGDAPEIPCEYLPISGILWTENRRPAIWREADPRTRRIPRS